MCYQALLIASGLCITCTVPYQQLGLILVIYFQVEEARHKGESAKKFAVAAIIVTIIAVVIVVIFKSVVEVHDTCTGDWC